MRAAASSGVRLAELVATISLGTDSHRSLKPLAAKNQVGAKKLMKRGPKFLLLP